MHKQMLLVVISNITKLNSVASMLYFTPTARISAAMRLLFVYTYSMYAAIRRTQDWHTSIGPEESDNSVASCIVEMRPSPRNRIPEESDNSNPVVSVLHSTDPIDEEKTAVFVWMPSIVMLWSTVDMIHLPLNILVSVVALDVWIDTF